MSKIIPIIAIMALVAVALVLVRKSPDAQPSTRPLKPVAFMAAASTNDLMNEIAVDFKKETGIPVVIVAGGSNALATQILSGAPADLFLSASLEWSNKVAEKGFADSSKPLLTNDLVLVVPKSNPGDIASPLDLLKPQVHKIALAGDNVPCGKYARQAFESLGIYEGLMKQSKIVRGQDVRAALAFVERAEAEAGVVYSTDAKISSKVKVVSHFDPKSYEPIIYPLVLLKEGGKNPSAVQFQGWLLGEQAKSRYLKHGFKLFEPGE